MYIKTGKLEQTLSQPFDPTITAESSRPQLHETVREAMRLFS
jgi:hypothetical protein